MLPPSQYPRQRLLIILTLATGVPAALVNGLFAFIANDSWGLALAAAGALMLPPSFIAWRLGGPPSRKALGLVLAYASLFSLAGGALFGWLFWYGVAFLGVGAFRFMQLAAIVPYLVLGFAAWRTTTELYGRAVVTETGSQSLLVILLYLGAFAIGSNLDHGLSSDRRQTERVLRADLRRSVLRVQACAIGHALAHPGSGYPASLGEMGPGSQNCLDRHLAKGRPKGLVVEYEPASPDAAGRIPSFTVHARTKRKRPASGEFFSAVGDTTGLVGETRGTAIATSVGVPGEEMIDRVAHLRSCALLARAMHADGAAPSSIADMAATLRRLDPFDVRSYLCRTEILPQLARLEAHDSLGTSWGYRASYTRIRDGSGRLTDFEIVARPIVYGESGIRSYFVRSDGPIHVTLTDRAATTSDVEVPACEYGEKRNLVPRYSSSIVCATMPSIQPPMVALVHDTVATANQVFTVAIRDRADPSRPADSSYEHHLSCVTTPGVLRLPVFGNLNTFQTKSELECMVNVDARAPSFTRSMRVVVYTRDRSGAIGRVESVVRVAAAPRH
jgi:hypothetical protein